MKINPNNGHFTLSEFGNRVILPNMLPADYIKLGFKLGNPNDPSAQGHIDQKTFSFLTVQFQDGQLRRITLGLDGNQVKTQLNQLGIKPQAYDWGVVQLGSHAQSGEAWVEIRYK